MRKYKLKQKKVVAVTWNDKASQEVAIEHLKELGCTDIRVTNSGAGISVDFKYPSPNSHKPIYYGALFCGSITVFENNGEYPRMYSSKDFNDLYELDNE
jgi:hypothetical protein